MRWARCQLLLAATVPLCGLAAPPAVADEAHGGGFELTGIVIAASHDRVTSGGELELKGEIRQAPLRVYGGEYSLAVSAGVDTTLWDPCACLCWGPGAIFLDGFESGDTDGWSLTVP